MHVMNECTGFQIKIFGISSRKLHKNYQMPDKMNSHIGLMLGVYKRFHQTVKYGLQRDLILQGLTGLEIKISMKASKTEKRFKIGFQQPKISLPKNRYL